MPGTPIEQSAEEHEGSSSGEEEAAGDFLQIGDIVFITRLQYVGNVPKSPLERRESFKAGSSTDGDKKITRFTLTAEGIADDKVSGIVADEWLQNPHHCLFRIETPSTVLDTGEQNSAEIQLEARANKASFEKSQGDILKYGQEVQLRHIHSDRLLSLNLLAAASAPGAWSVSVNAPSDFLCRQITLLPFNRSHNIGDPIKCGEAASIVFQTDNLKYYLQSEVIQEDLLDINSTHKPASWKFLKFESYKETGADAIKFGENITIKYTKLSMFMAITTSEGGRLPIVTKAEVKNFSNYWLLQNVNILEGGCVKWKSRFHIKNALTGQFLGPDLTLQPKPDSNFYFFFPKPDSFIEDSVIPNCYPLMIKSRWDRILSPDSRKTNEEALDHLVPFNELEPTMDSGEVGLVMQKLEADQRESLFELDYVKPWDGAFFNLIIGLYPKFLDMKAMLDTFQAEEKHSWEAVEALEKRLVMMFSALENITMSIREAAGEELESKQKIFTGLDFHSILIEIASVLQTLFSREEAGGDSGVTELLSSQVKLNLAAIWDLLNDVVLESEVAAQKVAEHQAYLCELLRFDTRRIGSLLTEVFRLVDPEIKNPKLFYHQWCARLTRLSKANLQEQVIYMRIIRNLCEIGDSGVLEYQKEITRNLFSSEIAIDLLVFYERDGEVAIHFGEMGAAVSAEEFKRLNPDLAPFLKENESGGAIVLLRELSGLENYVEYVQTALLLYHAVCRGRCFQAREHLERRSHMNVRMALMLSQDLRIHMDIRQAGLFMLEALCISVPPFEAYSDNNTSFNYAEIKLQQQKEDISIKRLINYSARNQEINKCLEVLFRFWMSKEIPESIKPKDPAEPMEQPNLFSPMKYLMGMLRLTLAMVEYKHATELWSQFVLKAVQYVLAGFTLSAHLYSDSHWGATLVAQAVKAGENERRVKIIVNEILSCVLNVLLAIKQVSRRHALGQAISLFISEGQTLRNPLLGTGLKHLSPVFEETLKLVTSSDRGDRIIDEYFKQTVKAEKRDRRRSIQDPLLAESRSESDFKPGFEFKELVAKAPLIGDLFIRVILEWPSFSSQLKNKVIDVMNEIFQGNRLFGKALRASDVISLGPVSQIFNRLRWLKDNMELSSLCVRAKFECSFIGKSTSLQQIIHLLEYLTDFCHPLNGSSDFVIKKTQNILRQLELHKDVTVVWQLVHNLEKMEKNLDVQCLRLKSALISFYFYFSTRNKTNIKELARLLVPSMLSVGVMQFASILRLLNDFAHLHIRDVTRIFVYILDEIQADESKGMISMNVFEKMMIDRTGMLKKNVQNVASSLLSEKISDGLGNIKERPKFMACLLENLALAAEDNPPVITQCRHLLPLSNLQEILSEEAHPLLLSAFTFFIYTVYVKKPTEANSQIKTLDKVADLVEFLQHVLQHAILCLQEPLEILNLVVEGSYALVYFKASPAYTDIHINLPSSKPELSKWQFLCTEWEGRLTGVLKTVPDILDAVDPDTSMVPILSDFYVALVACRAKVERMEEQTKDLLCFTPLLNVLRETGTRIKKSLDTLQVELSEEFMSVTLIESYPIPEGIISELQLALKGVLPFFVDSLSKDHLEVDQNMSAIMKTGCQVLPRVCPAESEDGYISAVVALIDTRLSQGPNITNKKDIKDLIASLAKKVRGLQKLFTSSKQRTLFFKIVEGIVPKEENIKFKIALNPLFQELKLMDYAVTSVLRNESHEEVMAALSFLIKLFLMQSQEFMEKFREGINENSMAYPLFMKFQTEMINGKALILEQAQIAKTRKSSAATPIQHALGSILKPKKPVQSAETLRQQKLLISMLNFIQICCDNCNEPFQIFYREQKNTEGKADVDLVNALAGFLIDIRSANDYLFNHETTFETLNAALSAFVDFVTGPCVTNQIVLGNNVRIYLVMNQLIEECQGKPQPRLIEIHRNCIRFLTCLLEGHPDESVYETMSKFLRLDLLREGCERIYQEFIVGKEEDISLELASLTKEHKDVVQATLMQAILLMKMRMVGVMHDELTKFEQALDDPKHCYGYFSKYIGYVEIDRNGKLESHLFPIPWKCKYITASTRNALIVEVNRSSHQEKTEDFLNQIPNCKLEMTHQQLLWCSKAFKSFSLHWQLFGKIAYYIALVINATLLATIQNSDFSDLKNNMVAFTLVATLGVLQISTYMACFFFNLIEYYPQAVAKGNPPIREFEMEEFFKVKDSDSQVMNSVHDTIMSGGEKDYKTQLQSKLKEVLLNFDMYYQYWYFLISIIAIYEPVFYPFVLLDMIKQTPELVNVLKAVTLNFRQLILTMWLGVIIVYLFSVGSFVFYAEYYDEESSQYCNDLWNCFFTTLNIGIRSGGGHMGTPDGEDYWARMVMDMFFYLILIVILLNIIFGIIIDAFAELRDQRTAVLDDVHNKCYICGQERSLIEQKGLGWSYHFMIEHSPFAYLSFLVYITDKKVYDCTGLEKHVKELYDSKDTDFMPKTSIYMEGKVPNSGEEEEED